MNALFTQMPTATPMNIPPSASPSWIQLMMGVAIIIVLIIVVGVWINQKDTLK